MSRNLLTVLHLHQPVEKLARGAISVLKWLWTALRPPLIHVATVMTASDADEQPDIAASVAAVTFSHDYCADDDLGRGLCFNCSAVAVPAAAIAAAAVEVEASGCDSGGNVKLEK